MSIESAQSARRNGARSRGRIAGCIIAIGCALMVAAPAWGAAGTATLAPIGTGSYLLTVTNTSSVPVSGFVFTAGEKPTNIVPTPACKFGNTPVAESINCTIALAPGASAQVCYTGLAPTEALPGIPATVLLEGPPSPYISAVTSAAVSACPLAGFKTATGSGSGGSKCVVPSLKGKTLVAAEKAITKAHCALGKVKKVKSSHVKKGRIVSQGAGAGKSLPSGAKVSLVVSKGK